MESDIQLLELADGIKDVILSSGFSSIKSILGNSASDISDKIGVDLYIAQIILREAKRVSTKMAAIPNIHDPLLHHDNATPAAVAAEKKEISLLLDRARREIARINSRLSYEPSNRLF
jgi:hypothetical protein